jgi:mRNA-degrading endonuclease RelE of RelBE toxin-antitoxin system
MDQRNLPPHSAPYRVLITSAIRPRFSPNIEGQRLSAEALEELLATLRTDPHNRTGQHKIKKLTGYGPGEGQWRIRWRDYRLRYDILGNDVVMYSFRHRKEAY